MSVSSVTVSNEKIRPRRILYIQRPTGGGSTIALYELIKGLNKTCYEPVVLFLMKNKYLDKFEALGIKTITIDRSKSQRQPKKRNALRKSLYHLRLWLLDVSEFLQLIRIIKRENADLVHLNSAFDRPVMSAALATSTPQVCHFRRFVKGRKLALVIRCLQRSCHAALYTTQAIADNYLKVGTDIDKSAVVYEPIDFEKFSVTQDLSVVRDEFSINNEDYIITNVGRITPWKGQQYFLQALAGLVKQYPNIKALIVGEPGNTHADKNYLNLLHDTVQQSSLQEHVIFTGRRDDIAEIMAISNVIVHSACAPEPFGLVIAEAMAAGTPIVATRGGGPAEIIEDGETGLLVPMKDAPLMQEAIEKLLKSQSWAAAMAAKAQIRVRERFSVEQHVNKVQTMYEEVLKNTSSPR